jgi:hypothetical protein
METGFELRDLLTALTDNDTRTRGVYGHNDTLCGAVQRELRDTCTLQTILYVRTNEVILFELLCKVLIIIPASIPGLGYCESEAYWVSFLSQAILLR